MTSIDGKTVGDQYLPSYLSISSWYSPSKCHIQIQSPSAALKVRGDVCTLMPLGVVEYNVIPQRYSINLKNNHNGAVVSFCVYRLAKWPRWLSNPRVHVTSPCTTRWLPGETSSYRASSRPTWPPHTGGKGPQSPLIKTFTPPISLLLPPVSTLIVSLVWHGFTVSWFTGC